MPEPFPEGMGCFDTSRNLPTQAAPNATIRAVPMRIPSARMSTVESISTPEQARAAIERFRADYAAVRAQVAKVIVGHDSVVDGVLTCLFCNGHVLLEGVPGLGKTLLVRTLAKALSL